MARISLFLIKPHPFYLYKILNLPRSNMFYPVNLLCRGGRLHMVWMAEYCPAKLREIRKGQMEKVDFVQLCNYICQVIKNESGISRARFSLRLSSKLMRGLVRLYERKMAMFVGDLFVMNAAMLKSMYTKATATTVSTAAPRRLRKRPRKEPQFAEEDQPSEEEDLEEKLLNSIVLAQNNDITLRECEVPMMRLPMNDFGDEGPAAIAELLGERTIEQMMARDMSALVTSAREFATSPHTPHVPNPALVGLGDMDTLPELNVTLQDKAAAYGEIPVEIQEIPRISEILPNIPVPGPAEEHRQEECIQPQEDEDEFELEVLSDVDKYTRCRHKKHAKFEDRENARTLDTNYMRSRIDDVYVELRCKPEEGDVIDFRKVPADLLLRRPAWSGPGHKCCVSKTLYDLYDRNLVTHKPATPERRERLQERRRTIGRSSLPTSQQPMEVIEEQQLQVLEQEPLEVTEQQQLEVIQQQQLEVIQQQQLEVIQQQQLEVIEQQPMEIEEAEQAMPANVSEMPTVMSVADKTTADIDYVPPTKIQRVDVSVDADVDGTSRRVSRLRTALRSSGVLETPQPPARGRKSSSGGSETPLGSVDRTPVCLNNSDPITESGQMLKDNWGPEGTIMNYFEIARKCRGQAVDVRVLFELGPKIPGKPRNVIVGKIFSSLLRLKQHQCLTLEKDKVTLEITNIKVGPMLSKCA